MRIGIDASNLRWGGGQTHLVELLRAADEARGQVEEVVVWGSADTLARLPERPWLHRIAEPMLERSLSVRLAWLGIRLPGLARDVDLVFAPGGIVPPIGCASVVMCQNTLLFDSAERRRYGLSSTRARLEALRIAHRASYRRASGVIFLTRHSEDSVRRDLAGRIMRSVVIPHGVAEDFFSPPRAQRAISEITESRPFRVIYVSAISVYKNHPELVAGVAAVRKRTPIELILIGPPESHAARAELDAAIQEHQAHRFVRSLGSLPYDQVHRHLVEADACVYPSTCETFPLALLEAMASGLPVACAAIPANIEVRGDAGVGFEGRDAASIAAALGDLSGDVEERSVLAERAYERARTFTWQRCAIETFRFLADTARA